MNEDIIIITDGIRKYPFDMILNQKNRKLINFSSLNDIQTINYDFDLVLVDIVDSALSIQVINIIRSKTPYIPVLYINDLSKNNNNKAILKNIMGYGFVRIVNFKEFDEKKVSLYIGALLHPEFPSKANEIAIILPVYNEEARFNQVCRFVENLKSITEQTNIYYNIYFMNDGSNDRTQELVEKLIKDENNKLNFIANKPVFLGYNFSINTRKAGTYIDAMRYIDADVFVFVDADNSFSIDDITKSINIINEGYYDIVAGTKDETAENRPPIRRLMSFCKRVLTKNLMPKGIYDSQTGLKAINATATRYMLPYLNYNAGLAVDLEMLYVAKKMNFRVLQLPVKCKDQLGSHVNVISDSVNFLKIILKIVLFKRRQNYGI